MSAFGPKQTWRLALHMSAFGGKADMTLCENPLSIASTLVHALQKSWSTRYKADSEEHGPCWPTTYFTHRDYASAT
jgi:hypothetical protein